MWDFSHFKKLEQQEIIKFSDEVKRLTKPTKTQLNKNDFIKILAKTYGTFVLEKIKEILLESINYSVETKTNKWYSIFHFTYFYYLGSLEDWINRGKWS